MLRSSLFLASFALLTLPSIALAQAPSNNAQASARAEDVAAARSLGVQGVRLADEGKCPEAIENLQRAEALYHAPTILGRLGECQVTVGQIVLGTENLNRVVREQLAPNAPQAFKTAQERARQVLDKALPRIAYLTVRVEPADASPTVAVDGVAIPAALIGAERPTDPGQHEVVATAAGHHEARSTVMLSEGSHQEVALALTPDASAGLPPQPVAPIAPTPLPVAPTPPEQHANHTAAYVFLGIGAAGLLTGTITGILAISDKGALDCPNKKCGPSQYGKLDSANTVATISTISFGVGVVGAAVGTVLLLTGKKTEAPPTAQVGSVSARPWFSDRAIGLEGAF